MLFLSLHHYVKGAAAAMDLQNIDTDMIIPKQFLKTIKRTGLGVSAFYEMRFNEARRRKLEPRPGLQASAPWFFFQKFTT